MSRLNFISRLQVNYVCHILSVAKCGYDNDYGHSFREFYDKKDFEVFSENKDELTIEGGSHAGKLLWIPAGLCMVQEDLQIFLENSIQQIEQDDFDLPVYDKGQKETVLKILGVFKKYYTFYKNEIWPKEQSELIDYIKKLKQKFEENNFEQKAEELIGVHPDENFLASLVLSISGGAEAIFIGSNEDIFCAHEDLGSRVKFIAHEYIIYLLEKVFPVEENWWLNKNIYSAREGLAEFYMQEILGPGNSFNEMQSYIDFYKAKSKEGKFSPKELFEMGKGII